MSKDKVYVQLRCKEDQENNDKIRHLCINPTVLRSVAQRSIRPVWPLQKVLFRTHVRNLDEWKGAQGL